MCDLRDSAAQCIRKVVATNGWMNAAVLLLLVAAPRTSAEAPPSPTSGSQQVVSTSDRSAYSEQQDPLEAAAIDAANAELRRKLGALSPELGRKQLDAVALIKTPSGSYSLVVRHKVNWVEWPTFTTVSAVGPELIAGVVAAIERMDVQPIRGGLLTQEDAKQLLTACHSNLVPVVRPLAPPYFNKSTNVRWDDRAAAPILRSFATIREEENACVRADLNLETGALLCREVACVVH